MWFLLVDFSIMNKISNSTTISTVSECTTCSIADGWPRCVSARFVCALALEYEEFTAIGMHKKLTEFIYWKRKLLKTNITRGRNSSQEPKKWSFGHWIDCSQRVEWTCERGTYFVDINGERDPVVHQKAPYSIRLWCNPHNLIRFAANEIHERKRTLIEIMNQQNEKINIRKLNAIAKELNSI